MNEVIKYHNDINKLSFNGFNEKELNLFFSLCYMAQENHNKEIELSFVELRNLSNGDTHLPRFLKTLKGVYDKLIKIPFYYHNENGFGAFTLFNKYFVDTSKKTVTIRTSDEFLYILNDLIGNYTKFELENFVTLKSSYSKNIFKILKQWENKKEKEFSMMEFKELLSVPKSYKLCDIDKNVLAPLRKDLPEFFPNLKIEKKKTGRTVTSIKFTWGAVNVDNEVIDYKEDDTKEIEVSQKIIDYIKDVCKHNRFIKEVLGDEENLINLLEKFQGKQVALVKGLEFCKKEIQKEINLTYLIKAIKSGAGVKRTKKILKIVKEEVEVPVPKEVPTEQPAPTVPAVEVPKIEETNSDLDEFEKLSKEEQSKIENIAIELYKKDNGVQSNPILNMRNTNIFKNALKKYILQAMNGEEVPAEEKVEVKEQPIEQKEEKKVYTVEDIPADKLLTKAGKKLGGSALENRIRKILKEMNGE